MNDYPVRLSLGPIPYFWPREQVFAFYDEMASSPVDIVYLGETVCAKRRQLQSDDWFEIGHHLKAAGKEVVLSTLVLVEAGSELAAQEKLCRQDDFPIEANDMGAVYFCQGKAFVAGTGVNIYNPRSLEKLAGLGMRRWVLPVELGQATLQGLQATRAAGVETEVFAFGRLPLAWSARCFTARAHNVQKDECGFRCLDYPDGLLVETHDDRTFLCINGIQTQSAQSCNLLAALAELVRTKVDILRISPQSCHTRQVIEVFEQCRQGKLSPAEGGARLDSLAPSGSCDGFWHGRPGMLHSARAGQPL